MRKLCAVIVLLSMGCGGVNVGQVADPVGIIGQLTVEGLPLSGVRLNLQPIGEGMPTGMAVTEGKFQGDVVPGKYTYFLSAGKDPAVFKKVPEEYHSGSMDREVDVAAGATLDLILD